jgi:hypothetical protein
MFGDRSPGYAGTSIGGSALGEPPFSEHRQEPGSTSRSLRALPVRTVATCPSRHHAEVRWTSAAKIILAADGDVVSLSRASRARRFEDVKTGQRGGMRDLLRYWLDLLRYWLSPNYLRWRWQRTGSVIKTLILVLLALLVGLGGYVTAVMASGSTANTTAAYVPPTQELVTVQRTVVHRVKGTGRVVTQVKKVAVPASPRERVVTLQGNGTTVVDEVTVQRPGVDRVVTDAQTTTVRQSQTVERPTTVTNSVTVPGHTVTSAGATQTVTRNVTEPGSTVTRTVTQTSPTQTVTRTVTEPAKTITNTLTTTETVATTVTETLTVTVPCKKSC